MEQTSAIRRVFRAVAVLAVLSALGLGILGIFRLLATAKAEDEATLAFVTEKYLDAENLRLEQTARNGDYMAALWSDGAGQWQMCEYERDFIWKNRWKPSGGSSVSAGKLGSWNYSSLRRDAVIIVFGVGLEDALGGYALKAQRYWVEGNQVLNVHVYPDSAEIYDTPFPLDQAGRPLTDANSR